MHLQGKSAIVTGGAGALGAAMARALLQRKAKVYILDVNSERGSFVEAELQKEFGKENVNFLSCDVSKETSFSEAFQSVVRRHGQVDVMVNNAGVVHERRDLDQMLLVNLGGTIRGSNLAIKHMRKDEGGKGGVIINVTSIAAAESFFALPTYTATKQGSSGFTNSWAANPYLKDLGLRFGQICPSCFTSYIIPNPEEQMLYAKEHVARNDSVGSQPYICPLPLVLLTAAASISTMNKLVADIAAGLIRLLEDDSTNGAMLFCCLKEGNVLKRMQLVDVQ